MDATNARNANCGYWQRWFLGLYLFERNSESSSEKSPMAVSQSIVSVIIACLYSQLILRVKHGYQQWRVTLKLLEHHAIDLRYYAICYLYHFDDCTAVATAKRANKQLSAPLQTILYTRFN